MEFLHEGSGVMGLWAVLLAAGAGLAAWKYQWVKARLPAPRAALVRWHGRFAWAFAAAAVVHVVSASASTTWQYAGAFLLGLTLLLGLSFRMGRSWFRRLLRLKLVTVALGAALLLLGHALVGEPKETTERGRGYESRGVPCPTFRSA